MVIPRNTHISIIIQVVFRNTHTHTCTYMNAMTISEIKGQEFEGVLVDRRVKCYNYITISKMLKNDLLGIKKSKDMQTVLSARGLNG